MATKKITLNELRRLVKQAINENEDSETEKAKQALIELLNLLEERKKNLFSLGSDLEPVDDAAEDWGSLYIRWKFQGEYFQTEIDVVAGWGREEGAYEDDWQLYPRSVEIKENQLFITTHDEDDYWSDYDEEQKASASKIRVDIRSVAPSFKENLEKSLLRYFDASNQRFSEYYWARIYGRY